MQLKKLFIFGMLLGAVASAQVARQPFLFPPQPPASGPFGGHATLPNDLVSVWPISTDGEDIVGTNELTNNGTVTFVAKGGGAPANMPSNVANFVAASSQSFSLASISLPSDYTFSFWFWHAAAQTNYAPLIDAHAAWTSQAQFSFYKLSPTTDYKGLVSDTSVSIGEPSPGSFSDDTWHHVVAVYTASDKILRIRVDGGTAAASSALTNARYSTATTFQIGQWNPSVISDNYWSGKVSSVYLWSRGLTSGEQDDLAAGAFY